MIDFCFTGGTHRLISVTNSGARWVTRKSKSGITFDKNNLKKGIKYLMDHCYFTLGDKLFKQIIGIPMGADPAPFMANLFLYYYESKWVRKVKKENLQLARKFGNTFRLIDDLCAVNDDGVFEKMFREIYPCELELNKEHGGNEVSFLDLSISLKDRQFFISLFDKRDNFPFSIVRMPYASSNIPSKFFYSSLGAEILRIGRANGSLNDFRRSGKALISRMVKQGAKDCKMKQVLRKVYGRHDILKKFAEDSNVFLRVLLN